MCGLVGLTVRHHEYYHVRTGQIGQNDICRCFGSFSCVGMIYVLSFVDYITDRRDSCERAEMDRNPENWHCMKGMRHCHKEKSPICEQLCRPSASGQNK
jgi:hypothetical protein